MTIVMETRAVVVAAMMLKAITTMIMAMTIPMLTMCTKIWCFLIGSSRTDQETSEPGPEIWCFLFRSSRRD